MLESPVESGQKDTPGEFLGFRLVRAGYILYSNIQLNII